MASGMKYWFGAVLVGFALIAAWQLPPDRFPPRDVNLQTGESIRLGAIYEEGTNTAETLRRVLWSDSLSTLTVAGPRQGFTLLMPANERVNGEQVAKLEAGILSEIQALGPREAEMVFGYVLQPLDQNRQAGFGVSHQERAETFVGTRDGIDYCLQIRLYNRGRLGLTLARKLAGADQTLPRSGTLGACRPYLEHGQAGADIQRWLERGGINFAVETGESETDLELYRQMRLVYSSRGRRVVFSSPGLQSGFLEGDRCGAGQAEACAYLFFNPAAVDPILASGLEQVRRSPAVSIGTRFSFLGFLVDPEYLLSDLEAEFGPEAFGHFWRSSLEVEAAFREAFGVDAGVWVRDWVDATIGLESSGPGLPRSASSGSMLTISLLLGLAYLRSRRRRVA